MAGDDDPISWGDPSVVQRDDEAICSGNPQALWDYAEAGAERVNVLRSYQESLAASLAAYRQAVAYAAASGHMPDIDASVGHYGLGSLEEDIAETINAREHLDGFVEEIGTAFWRADQAAGNLAGSGPDTTVTVTAGELLEHGDIGYADPDLEELRLQGVDDARHLAGLLEAQGIDPTSFDPADLENLNLDDPSYSQIYHTLANAEDDPAYWHGLFNELGTDGIQATLGTIEMLQAHQTYDADGAPLGWDVENELLNPFLEGFATSTHNLDDSVLNGLLDHEGELWALHQLAMLQGTDGSSYEPEWLADASHEVLFNDDVWTGAAFAGDTYPPLAQSGSSGPLWNNPELSFPHLTSMSALAGSPEASWEFMAKGDDHVELILRPYTEAWINIGNDLHGQPFGSNPFSIGLGEAQVQGLIQQYTAQALVRGLFTHPTQNDLLDDPQQTAMVSYAISSTAESTADHPPARVDPYDGTVITDIELHPEMQAAMAAVSGPYSNDLALILDGKANSTQLDLDNEFIDSPDGIVEGFMQEVSKSPRGREIMAANGAGLVSLGMVSVDDGVSLTGAEAVVEPGNKVWGNSSDAALSNTYFSNLISAWDNLNLSEEEARQTNVDLITDGGRLIADILGKQSRVPGAGEVGKQMAGDFAEWVAADPDLIPITEELDNSWSVVEAQAAETLWNDPDLRQAVLERELRNRPQNLPADPSEITKDQFMAFDATNEVALQISFGVAHDAEGSAATETLYGR